LTLSWPEFKEHVGYKANYDPRGIFSSVASDKLDDFGGVEGYIQYLRGHHSVTRNPFAPVTEQDLAASGIGQTVDKAKVDQALTVGEKKLEHPPQLTEGLDLQEKQITVRPRDAAFSIEVKRAYGFRCAVCGSRLQSPKGQPEVQSAHIYPKSKDSSDDLRNGVCLCRRHHWALDVGWISLSDDHTVLVHPDLPEDEDYSFIRQYAGEKILPPSDERFAPHPMFMQEHRKMMGFD
jgi:putative restriction endonuclease